MGISGIGNNNLGSLPNSLGFGPDWADDLAKELNNPVAINAMHQNDFLNAVLEDFQWSDKTGKLPDGPLPETPDLSDVFNQFASTMTLQDLTTLFQYFPAMGTVVIWAFGMAPTAPPQIPAGVGLLIIDVEQAVTPDFLPQPLAAEPFTQQVQTAICNLPPNPNITPADVATFCGMFSPPLTPPS